MNARQRRLEKRRFERYEKNGFVPLKELYRWGKYTARKEGVQTFAHLTGYSFETTVLKIQDWTTIP